MIWRLSKILSAKGSTLDHPNTHAVERFSHRHGKYARFEIVAAEERGNAATPMVTLATAHAAKFPDAVEAACGIRPDLPPHMADLFEREERVTRVANDLAAIQNIIRKGINA